MYQQPARGQIRPKISTMPRQQSEAAAFLDVYKLVIEKNRLQQELQTMDQRRQQIVDRLSVLETQVTALEDTAHQLREGVVQPSSFKSQKQKGRSKEVLPPVETVETLFLEY
jgi:predicted  nucleic acid-binding Zn-ribbon protein